MGIIDDKWEDLFNKYDIEYRINKEGLFYITADQIKEFKEPRLMTKFDTAESLPRIFRNKISILPVTRGKYVLGNFSLYEELPEINHTIKHMTNVIIPDFYQTIDLNNITSEANAINVMGLTGILDDFLNEDNMIQTVSGRMSSGSFDFKVYGKEKIKYNTLSVQNSQIEIDGGFENRNVFALIEGKNVVHSNFLVRQLYYPYRLWKNKISKPIRNIFMIYSNNIFRLLEYEFYELDNYNSARLIQERNYSLEEVDISLEDIISVYKNTRVLSEPNVTFVQADSFSKVISLIEHLNESPLTPSEIAVIFGFEERQSDYYYNACRYLGLAKKQRDDENKIRVFITKLGRDLLIMTYKKRQLAYVQLILQHQIFNDIFSTTLDNGEIPDKLFVIQRMRELEVCSEKLIGRRASSVVGWIRWIMNLIN